MVILKKIFRLRRAEMTQTQTQNREEIERARSNKRTEDWNSDPDRVGK